MSATAQEASTQDFQLPARGLRLKLTTDLGSVQQQVRHFFKPVTLLGSSPQAHLRIESDVVCDFHCALINTGRCILLKDLHTPTGLLRNRETIRLGVLSDGDVLRVGPSPLHIALRAPVGTPAPAKMDDTSTVMRMPRRVRLIGPGTAENIIESSVALIGRRLGSEVYLNHEDVAPVHAILAAVESELIFYNCAATQVTELNGGPVDADAALILNSGDTLRIGPFELRVDIGPCQTDGADMPPAEVGSSVAEALDLPPPPVSSLGALDTLSAHQRIQQLLASVRKMRDGLK